MWTSITTSLAVTGSDLDPAAVERALGFARPAARRPGLSVHHGPGWWALTVDAECSADLDGQIAELARLAGPHLDGIGTLAGAGCRVQVAVSGTVELGGPLTLSPESAARLAALGLPVSFTTLLPDNLPAEDPLDFLG
ncbi:DUF4279 domain-containing protein [Streptomyces sp. SBR177]|uniref:DUF4279 domain-containing protein n=1 Tax=unclassified Streptomyces TaxID=2593676 RepID=UPI0036FD8D04